MQIHTNSENPLSCKSLCKFHVLSDIIYISNYGGIESCKSKNNF